MRYKRNKLELDEKGFSLVPNLFSDGEIGEMLACIDRAEQDGISFMKSSDLFAIRQLLKNLPELIGLLFNGNLNELIRSLSDADYFLTKAIYFDKPDSSNWFVPYHQDLSISVDKRAEVAGFSNWTFKKGQHGVQPPLHILQDTITLRIHLDDTNLQNGALKVIPKSHLRGEIPTVSKDWNVEEEVVCEVEKGGAMLMKPLILHASNRTTNGMKRRVIHLEFNSHALPAPLEWLERLEMKTFA